MTELDHNIYMKAALEEALKAESRGEVPIGAVLVNPQSGEIVAQNGNRTRELSDPTAHAEILVIRELCKKLGAQRIPDYLLYVALEPCTMCSAAIAFARIPKLVYGASDPKGGGVEHGARFFEQPTCHHKIEVVFGIKKDECAKLLKEFFKDNR